MLPFPVANVVVDGQLITGSRPAIVQNGTIMSPIDPFVLRFASAVTPVPTGTDVTISRGERWVRIEPGTANATVAGVPQRLPRAPYVSEGRVIVPLAAVARSLGMDVHYDARSHSIVLSSLPVPITTMTPFLAVPALPVPRPTFTEDPVSTPRPIFTGIPRARRTPIEVGRPPGTGL